MKFSINILTLYLGKVHSTLAYKYYKADNYLKYDHQCITIMFPAVLKND